MHTHTLYHTYILTPPLISATSMVEIGFEMLELSCGNRFGKTISKLVIRRGTGPPEVFEQHVHEQNENKFQYVLFEHGTLD